MSNNTNTIVTPDTTNCAQMPIRSNLEQNSLNDVFDISDGAEFIEPEIIIRDNMTKTEIDKINAINSQRF